MFLKIHIDKLDQILSDWTLFKIENVKKGINQMFYITKHSLTTSLLKKILKSRLFVQRSRLSDP